MPQDHEPINEQEASVRDTSELETIQQLNALPERLGFVESTELSQLRTRLTEAVALESTEVNELIDGYRASAEAVVSQIEGPGYAQAQIGLNIRMALVWRDGGRADRYVEDLQDAANYAWNMREDDVVALIETALQSAAAAVSTETNESTEPTAELLAQACREILGPEDCEELAQMPLEDGIGYAFSLLLEQGIEDPEAYLREKGLLE